ncbi:MAG: ferredoxin--NADP+ reductase, partial [Candidatus Azotimanducaceae bacterium]
VGYKGKPLPEIPYHESWGTILNEAGRVVDEDGEPVTGIYTAGWIKRGPSGVIGTNKTCAQETVACMVKDLAEGQHLQPDQASVEAARETIEGAKTDIVDYPGWVKINAEEVSRGESQGRPRVKFTRVEEMLEVSRG